MLTFEDEPVKAQAPLPIDPLFQTGAQDFDLRPKTPLQGQGNASVHANAAIADEAVAGSANRRL